MNQIDYMPEEWDEVLAISAAHESVRKLGVLFKRFNLEDRGTFVWHNRAMKEMLERREEAMAKVAELRKVSVIA